MKRILIVDDDQSAITAYGFWLDGMYEIESALSKDKAIEKIEEWWFDVILSDWNLWPWNEEWWVEIVKAAWDTPVIAISSEDKLNIKMLKAWAKDYQSKREYDIRELFSMIEKVSKED